MGTDFYGFPRGTVTLFAVTKPKYLTLKCTMHAKYTKYYVYSSFVSVWTVKTLDLIQDWVILKLSECISTCVYMYVCK